MSPEASDTQPITVLSVGHCTPDAWMLRTAVQRVLPDAEVHPVNDETELRERIAGSSGPMVLLVNRLLDGRFPHADGIELIEAHGGGAVAAALISNLEASQASAEAVGGVAGFGKTALNDAGTAEKLRNAVEIATSRRSG
ncbi:MAG: hypothetical protein GY728_13550 [Phycisphaeraceae bacterium]|nr:hypothetical protein [Phycisphaeraceae bacterium]MCP4497249.1 hypothetical protein [Phycisphaeraceae bacterium]MCP4797263.1 hypothetical protein [Phycisphaeraceae bacterium]